MSEYQARVARRRFIVTSIEQGEAIRVFDVATMFSCSERGVLNDLRYLRSLGLKVGTRRGVIEANKDKSVTLIRQLEFPAQYKEAAVSILSYFSRVLEQKYPDMEAGVSISQKGQVITLKVETKEGDIVTIERTLDDYGQVVIGKLSPSDLFNEPLAIMELNNRLEIARLELKLKEQSHLMISSYQEKRIESLEGQLNELRTLIGNQLSMASSLTSTITTLANNNTASPTVSQALDIVVQLIKQQYTKKNEASLRESLEAIRKEDDTLFKKLSESASTIGHSIVANVATPWVVAVINSFPK